MSVIADCPFSGDPVRGKETMKAEINDAFSKGEQSSLKPFYYKI